jgi:ATP-dependent Clp protease ATP-binding subunit ClpC
MDAALMPRLPYLTTRAHNVFALAHDIADRLGHDDVTPVHLAIAVIRQTGVPVGALYNLGVPLDVLEHELDQHLPAAGTARPATAARSWTPWDQQMIDKARREARELGTEFYGSEHLLLALVRDSTGALTQVLAQHGVTHDNLRREILRIYNARPDEPSAGRSAPAV